MPVQLFHDLLDHRIQHASYLSSCELLDHRRGSGSPTRATRILVSTVTGQDIDPHPLRMGLALSCTLRTVPVFFRNRASPLVLTCGPWIDLRVRFGFAARSSYGVALGCRFRDLTRSSGLVPTL